jgi:CRP-like cAMP-binding protein
MPSRNERNILLSLLPDNDYEKLEASFELVTLGIRDTLYEVNTRIDFAYFPRSFVGSMLTVMADGSESEFATVGHEGMFGLPAFLGAIEAPHRSFCQVAGEGIRIPMASFLRHLNGSPALRDTLQRYTQALFTQVAQHASCKSEHNVTERTAKWLLLTRDRVGADDFGLTQDFLSQMLGVRRAGVSDVMSKLREQGYLDYLRGEITVKDRHGLEQVACECYQTINREYERLFQRSLRNES